MTPPASTRRLIGGRYRLDEVVGCGRSVVYRAADLQLHRDVAVKRVQLAGRSGGTDIATLRERAMREARTSARISSSLVIDVYDVVEERGAVWLVMELVRAPSLERVVRREGPLDERRAALLGLGVLTALEAAHAAGVVHRDVKPANVLVCRLDPSALIPVKLGDFGVATRGDEAPLTSPGAVVGSPAYMAPEQAAGRRVGPEADMWALGTLLYFAVEGETPFAGDTAVATATAVVHARPRPQQRPGRLSRVISLLLDKRPERRPDARRVRAILRSIALDARPETRQASVAALRGRPVTDDTQSVAVVPDFGDRDRPGVSADTQAIAAVPGQAGRGRRLVLGAAAAVLAATGAAGLVGVTQGGTGGSGDPDGSRNLRTDLAAAEAVSPDAGDQGAGTAAATPSSVVELQQVSTRPPSTAPPATGASEVRRDGDPPAGPPPVVPAPADGGVPDVAAPPTPPPTEPGPAPEVTAPPSSPSDAPEAGGPDAPAGEAEGGGQVGAEVTGEGAEVTGEVAGNVGGQAEVDANVSVGVGGTG